MGVIEEGEERASVIREPKREKKREEEREGEREEEEEREGEREEEEEREGEREERNNSTKLVPTTTSYTLKPAVVKMMMMNQAMMEITRYYTILHVNQDI